MLGFSRFRSAVLAGLLLSGCDYESDSPPEHEPDLAELSERHACADLIVVAADVEGSQGLFLTIDDGLVEELLATSQPIVAHYAIGDDDELDDEPIELRWVSGRNVYAGHCGLDNGEGWEVDSVEQAIAGEIDVELIPSPDGVRVDIEIRGVLLSPLGSGQAKQAAARELPPLVIDDLALGQ
jgi:hypothetical protein